MSPSGKPIAPSKLGPIGRKRPLRFWAVVFGCIVFMGVLYRVWVHTSHPSQLAAEAQLLDEQESPALNNRLEAGRMPAPKLTSANGDSGPPPGDEDLALVKTIASCWENNKCPPGTLCWMADDHRLGCFASNCRSVADPGDQCGPGQACRPLSTHGEVYRCVEAGLKPEGSFCNDQDFLGDVGRTCASQLICFGDVCRRTCTLKQGAACPAGQTCVRQSDRDGVCVPGCSTDSDCINRESCVRTTGQERGVCLKVPKTACRPDVPDSCGQGQSCEFATKHGKILASQCRPSCRNGCPSGTVCSENDGVCLRVCDSTRRDCPSGESCLESSADSAIWLCRRATQIRRPALDPLSTQGYFGTSVAEPN